MLVDTFQSGLSHKSGLVRKGTVAVLAVPRWLSSWNVNSRTLAATPPVLANSFPKSGTHLLQQIVEGLPERQNYGTFLASTTSSFQFRERSDANTCRFIRGFVPGEIVRGHLYFEPVYAEELAKRHTVNYFIYRDPRDVVVSEAHYLRGMNRWHRLHPYFRDAASIEDAIMLSITGLDPPVPGISYPHIGARFARYQGWLSCNDCLPIRFEDLVSERQAEVIRQAAEFYAARSSSPVDVDACVQSMSAHIAPHKSHTFRSGKKAGWQREFTPVHRQRFAEVAGQLLIELGYEPNFDWVEAPVACQ